MDPRRRLILAVLALVAVGACHGGERKIIPAPLSRVWAYNAQAPQLRREATLDSLLAQEQGLPTAHRIGLWARRFRADTTNVYCFGPKPGGYVSEGRLVDDAHVDCISLLYRVCELAQARTARDAVTVALRTRFAGASLDSVVDATGRVDYTDPAHLDYSLDMVQSGLWGADVTPTLTGAVRDRNGSARYAPGSFAYVPTDSLRTTELHDGDLVWFVLSPASADARRLRDGYGLVIGHAGIVIVEDGQRILVHAASSDLPGEYTGGHVVSVPLMTYLSRVDRFAGIVVTRFVP